MARIPRKAPEVDLPNSFSFWVLVTGGSKKKHAKAQNRLSRCTGDLKTFSELHLDYSTDPMSLLGCDGGAHGERCVTVSKPDQVTGRCYGCHMLLE